MGIADDLGARKPAAINDRGVVEFIGEDQVFLTGQGWDCAEVGGEAGLEGDRRFHPFECRNPLLEFEVQVHGPGDGADRARSHAGLIHRVLGGLHQFRVVGQPQIVV